MGDVSREMQLVCSIASDLVVASGFWGWFRVWMAYSCFGYVFLTGSSLLCFIYYYGYPTYAKWRFKSNPKYPSPQYVLGELLLGGVLGPPVTALAPSIHLYLIANGTLSHHCDTPQTLWYKIFSAGFVLLVTDLYEWAWHYCGHWVESLWAVHKHHHKFSNPTPFGTIADYPFDNIMRSMYFNVVNCVSYVLFQRYLDVDMVYVATGLLTLGWGMILHCGHE